MNDIININGSYTDELILDISNNIINGKIVIMPSDTIYGFLCKRSQEKRLRSLKKRDEKPFLMLISDITQLAFLNINYKSYEHFLNKYWPRPVTFLMNDDKNNKTGVRFPNHDALRQIIGKVGEPLISTSVNYSGCPVMNDINLIINEFGNKVDLIINDADFQPETVSTIADLTAKPVRIIRQGSITIEEDD